jgi:hypothetical protein
MLGIFFACTCSTFDNVFWEFCWKFEHRAFNLQGWGAGETSSAELAKEVWGFCNFDLRLRNSVLGGIA